MSHLSTSESEHKNLSALLQPLAVTKWKWDYITMDFMIGLPKSQISRDAIWAIVDHLTKSAHFLPIKTTNSIETLAKLYIREIVRLHGIPISIVFDWDSKFTSKFCETLQQALGSQLHFRTTFHPQTDGQSDRTIQILEDMMRACILDFGRSWEDHLSLAEFAYNNSYQSSVEMAPYEAIYGRPCRSPNCWVEIGDKVILRPDLVQETTEKIKTVKQCLIIAQS